MRAVVYKSYGGPEVLEFADLPKPAPGPGQVLVRIRATTVTSGDARMRAFDLPAPFRIPGRFMLGWPTPKKPVLGYEFAGEIESMGSGVSRLRPGDRVYGTAFGAHAEYITIAETGAVAPIPRGLSFAEAAALPFGMTTAMYFLRAGKVEAGQRMLLIGASGCVGIYALQLARHMGAEVTAVCSGRNADLVRSFGANRIIDYTTEAYDGTGPWDVIMDTVGAIDFNRSKPMLRPGGVFLNVVIATSDVLATLSPFKGGRRIVGGSFETTQAMLLTINDLIEADAIAPVIDRSYTFDEIRDAHALVDSKRKRGAVVVIV